MILSAPSKIGNVCLLQSNMTDDLIGHATGQLFY